MSDDPLNATITHREDLTGELAVFKVSPDAAMEPFVPGQFTTLGLPKPESEINPNRRRRGPQLVRRAYSIASSPDAMNDLEFYVVVVDGGKLTPRLWDLHEGDRLFMDPTCKGHFTLDGIPDGQVLVCIATGTGLAPFVSMMRTYRGTGRWKKLVIIHGTRLAKDLGYRAELEQAAHEDDSIIYLPACTREPDTSNWQGLRGRVHITLEPEFFEREVGLPLDPANSHLFLCGNPAMIDQCEEELQDRGFVIQNRDHPDGNVHFERYW